jgi:peptide/nickel transport system permease protein
MTSSDAVDHPSGLEGLMRQRKLLVAIIALVSLTVFAGGSVLAGGPKRGGTLRIAYGNDSVPVGLIAGYYGGRIDMLMMRVMDLILAFPIYRLAIIIMVISTPTAGLIGTIKVVGAMAIVRVPIYARLARGTVLSIKEKEYIEAGRALGLRDPWILMRHVLPNTLAPIVFIQANPWLALFPGAAIFVTVLGFNLFGDGLRDAFGPRLK